MSSELKVPKYVLDPQKIAELPETKRAEALALMEGFVARSNWNPMEGYVPTPAGLELHSQVGKPIRALFGGNRAGKTTWGVCDSQIQSTPQDLLPEHLHAFKRWECPVYTRVCSPSGKLLSSVMLPKFMEWTPKALIPKGWGQHYSKAEYILRLDCGCVYFFMTYEQDLDKFGGASLHRVLYDEEPPQDIRDECEARLWDTDGEELFTMTPLDGMSWTHDEIYMKRDQDFIATQTASTLDNPYLPAHIQERLDRRFDADDPRRQARLEGQFVHFGGLVYPNWKEVQIEPVNHTFVHACSDVVVGIDPGMVGCGLAWVAIDGQGRATVFDSMKVSGADADDIGKFIKLTNEKWNLSESQLQYVIDPSARARSLTDGQSMEEALQRSDIYCAWGSNDREGGCMMMRKRIRNKHIAFCKGMTDFEWEIIRYRVEERSDGKWDVKKVDDHVMDAVRYAVGHFFYEPEEAEPKPRRDEDIAFPFQDTKKKDPAFH